ncbi:Hypothetical predicted protein, partial [Mytilus galloprovincialis]
MCGTSHADVTVSLTTGVHSYPANGIIRYNQLIEGNLIPNYNFATGIYTVPPLGNGRHLVSVTMMSGLVPAHLTLRKNGLGIKVWLFTGTPWEMATQTIFMILADGDRIS